MNVKLSFEKMKEQLCFFLKYHFSYTLLIIIIIIIIIIVIIIIIIIMIIIIIIIKTIPMIMKDTAYVYTLVNKLF